MPHSELHKQKLKKNLAVLGLILFLFVLIFFVTIVRMSEDANAQTMDQSHKFAPFSVDGPYKNTRGNHQDGVENAYEGWMDDYQAKEPVRMGVQKEREEDRKTHQNHIAVTQKGWLEDYEAQTPAREEKIAEMEDGRQTHQENDIAPRSQEWWDNWLQKHRTEPD